MITSDVTATTRAGIVENSFTILEKGLVAIAGAAILACGLITSVSVVGRWLFGWGVPDGEIIIQNLMILACVLPLSAVVGQRAHIAVDLVFRHFSLRLRKWVGVFTGVIAVLMLVLISWSGWLDLSTVWARQRYYDGRLEIPEWPAHLFFVIGYIIFLARSVQRLGDQDQESKPEH